MLGRMKNNRYVLCRPEGGLNDVLCQIERVCRYAEKFDRNVIIDTNHHSTCSIKDHFSKYFVSKQKRVALDLTSIEFDLKNVSVVPSFLTSDPFQYDAHYHDNHECFVERNTHQPITFDFSRDYAECLLVHHDCGRLCGASVAALSRLRLHDNLSNELTKRLKSIGSSYASVHIRNTDYKTNYRSLLKSARKSSCPARLQKFVRCD